MKHHLPDVSSSDAPTSYSHLPPIVAGKVTCNVSGLYNYPTFSDYLLVFYFPFGLRGNIDIHLRTGGAKQCQATIEWTIHPIMNYASPYSIVQIPPLSGDP